MTTKTVNLNKTKHDVVKLRDSLREKSIMKHLQIMYTMKAGGGAVIVLAVRTRKMSGGWEMGTVNKTVVLGAGTGSIKSDVSLA